MYKILIKYTSTFKKTFWYSYEVEDGVEFVTDDIDVLKKEIDKIDKQIGYENIRIVRDITYDVMVDVTDVGSANISYLTTDDINNIYNTAFAKVFRD